MCESIVLKLSTKPPAVSQGCCSEFKYLQFLNTLTTSAQLRVLTIYAAFTAPKFLG